MDPERQPLLRDTSEARLRRLRSLTTEEVLIARQDARWRRTHFSLMFMFWGLLAMLLSIVACILVTAPSCKNYSRNLGVIPAVPPVHLSFSPLIASLNEAANNQVNGDGLYAM